MARNINQTILQSWEYLLNNFKNHAPFNSVKYGTVIKSLSNGKYTVVIEGVSQDIPSLNNQTYNVSDSVIIVIPNNNKVKQFILGKVKY